MPPRFSSLPFLGNAKLSDVQKLLKECENKSIKDKGERRGSDEIDGSFRRDTNNNAGQIRSPSVDFELIDRKRNAFFSNPFKKRYTVSDPSSK